jgi:hypothetical protein
MGNDADKARTERINELLRELHEGNARDRARVHEALADLRRIAEAKRARAARRWRLF